MDLQDGLPEPDGGIFPTTVKIRQGGSFRAPWRRCTGMNGIMSRKCKSCCGGLITVHSSEGRKQTFCHCPTGQAAEQEDLKARLLAAFYELSPKDVTVSVRIPQAALDAIPDPSAFVQAAVDVALAEMGSAR